MIMRNLLIAALLTAALWAQQVNQANNGVIVVGNEAQPVQPLHKSNIQEAIKLAGTTGTVIIPADYLYPTETFTNPNNITVLDYRNKTLKVWGGGVELASGSKLILGYSAATNYYVNSATGTVCNKLVKLDGTGKAVVTSGGETLGIIGVAIAGCGTSGTVQVATSGQVPILFDTPSVTVSDYVAISAGSGLVSDVVGGSPGSGQNIGRIILKPDGSLPSACNAGANCYVQLQLGSASGGGAGCASGCVLTTPPGSQTVTQPGGTQFIIAGGNFVVQAGGATNAIFGPDSGANAQTNGSDNTFQVASGTAPGVQSLPPGGNFLPVWTPKVAGVVYPSVLESQANRGIANGYATLNTTGQVPMSQIVLDTSGCGPTTFPKGDGSGCSGSSANPPFGNIQSGTNNSAALVVDTGGSLVATNSGVIDATTVRGVVYPVNGAAPGGLGADNRALNTVGAGNISGVDLPDCKGANFLQHDNTLHTYPCSSPAGTTPPIQVTCNGITGGCPDTSPFTGLGAVAILQSFSIPGNTITTGRCAHVIAWVQHPTGTAQVTYNWNIGGTGARGAAPTGGIAIVNQATTSLVNFQQVEAYFCNAGGTAVNYARQPQMQTGSAQVVGGANATSVNWTVTQQVNLTFSVANTDTVAFNGGYVTF